MLKGRIDALDIEGQKPSVAASVCEKLQLVSRTAISGYAHTAFLGGPVWCPYIHICCCDDGF